MLVRYQHAKVQMNVAQMLPVPWSKVTSIGDKLLQVLHTRSISGFDTPGYGSYSEYFGDPLNTACTRSILGFDTLQHCLTPSNLRFITLEYSLYLKYLGILYCSYFKYSEYLGISYCKYSILGVLQGFIFRGTSNTRSISGFFTPRYSGLEYYS